MERVCWEEECYRKVLKDGGESSMKVLFVSIFGPPSGIFIN